MFSTCLHIARPPPNYLQAWLRTSQLNTIQHSVGTSIRKTFWLSLKKWCVYTPIFKFILNLEDNHIGLRWWRGILREDVQHLRSLRQSRIPWYATFHDTWAWYFEGLRRNRAGTRAVATRKTENFVTIGSTSLWGYGEDFDKAAHSGRHRYSTISAIIKYEWFQHRHREDTLEITTGAL